MRLNPVWVSVLTAAWAAAGSAAQFSPRVLSPHHADAYSMKTFAQHERWKDLEGEDKVYAIYAYLADRRTGIFPMGAGAWEGEDMMYEYGYVRDPVKMINVYSAGYCDILGPVTEGVMEGVGAGPARTVNLPGLSHVLAEVKIDGRWAYVDLDLRGIFRRPDGTLASTAEARKDPSLWEGPRGPLFFPLANLGNLRQSYARSSVAYRYGVHTGGHTMDFLLRRGETFTRWWRPRGERWNHHERYHQGAMLNILRREPVGPKCKHVNWSMHGHGNGRFVYEPDLTVAADVADGLYDGRNVIAGPGGLTLVAPGQGYAVFEVRSPYVIVPSVNDYETRDDDEDASVVSLDASGADVSVSIDNGLTWAPVLSTEGRADLTRQVAGTYGFLLKIDLEGVPGEAIVRTLNITTWVQLHPASLPGLREGVNRMRYVTGDHYGLNTRVVEIRTNGSDREDFLKHCAVPPEDFDPDRRTNRARGRFVARAVAPPGTKIAWFSAGGAFNTQRGANAARTANRMAWAVGEPKDFTPFYQSDVPTDQSHWHYNADIEVRLDTPAKKLFIEYVGDPGVNNLRIYAHCVEDSPRPETPVVITHAWTEAGDVERSRTVRIENGAGEYEIVAGSDPRDVSIEMSVPSAGEKK